MGVPGRVGDGAGVAVLVGRAVLVEVRWMVGDGAAGVSLAAGGALGEGVMDTGVG